MYVAETQNLQLYQRVQVNEDVSRQVFNVVVRQRPESKDNQLKSVFYCKKIEK